MPYSADGDEQAQEFIDAGEPVISIETKKKGNIENFKNPEIENPVVYIVLCLFSSVLFRRPGVGGAHELL